MTEGQSVTAAAAHSQAADAGFPAARARSEVPAPPVRVPPDVTSPLPSVGDATLPAQVTSARVDARLLESAVLALRKPIVAASLPLETPGAEDGRAERRKLLDQIDGYLLPRLREPGAPVLVALVGSTGAGKSTLVNSLVGADVSMTGIRRPTTNSPVLACHPDDVDWFAENVFLPTVPRVRQEGLARSGRDGLLVLAANEGMPRGVALLDTPDIDSVVQAHREFAHQFLDASDLWLFMTTASRYADAAVWELLQHARDRGAALGLVLSRVPAADAAELLDHFGAMLEANGLGGKKRFLIPETVLSEGRLPSEASGQVREWLEQTGAQSGRRIAVLSETMSGVLDTFRSRVPVLAAEVEAQVTLSGDLTASVEGAYQEALTEIDQALGDGSLLRGEVLARWQDLAGTGDLLGALQSRRGGRRQRHSHGPARAQVLKMALREAVESLIISVAVRAAEDSVTRWRDHPAGAALIDRTATVSASADWGGSQEEADIGLIFGLDVAGPASSGGRRGDGEAGARDGSVVLGRASPELAMRAVRAVSAWQDQVVRLVKAENITKRSLARAVTFDEESLATVLMIGMVGSDPSEGEGGTAAIPQRLLASLFGAGPLREVTAAARADLRDRISLIFDEEMRRFTEVIDSAGTPDAAVPVRLYQATYSLEVVR